MTRSTARASLPICGRNGRGISRCQTPPYRIAVRAVFLLVRSTVYNNTINLGVSSAAGAVTAVTSSSASIAASDAAGTSCPEQSSTVQPENSRPYRSRFCALDEVRAKSRALTDSVGEESQARVDAPSRKSAGVSALQTNIAFAAWDLVHHSAAAMRTPIRPPPTPPPTDLQRHVRGRRSPAHHAQAILSARTARKSIICCSRPCPQASTGRSLSHNHHLLPHKQPAAANLLTQSAVFLFNTSPQLQNCFWKADNFPSRDYAAAFPPSLRY